MLISGWIIRVVSAKPNYIDKLNTWESFGSILLAKASLLDMLDTSGARHGTPPTPLPYILSPRQVQLLNMACCVMSLGLGLECPFYSWHFSSRTPPLQSHQSYAPSSSCTLYPYVSSQDPHIPRNDCISASPDCTLECMGLTWLCSGSPTPSMGPGTEGMPRNFLVKQLNE